MSHPLGAVQRQSAEIQLMDLDRTHAGIAYLNTILDQVTSSGFVDVIRVPLHISASDLIAPDPTGQRVRRDIIGLSQNADEQEAREHQQMGMHMAQFSLLEELSPVGMHYGLLHSELVAQKIADMLGVAIPETEKQQTYRFPAAQNGHMIDGVFVEASYQSNNGHGRGVLRELHLVTYPIDEALAYSS